MSYGLEIKNSDNNIIIDTEYPVFEINSSGTINKTSQVAYPNISGFDETRDLLLVSPDGTPSNWWNVNYELIGSTKYWPSSSIVSPSSHSYIIVRDYVHTASTSDYGLEIYNASGGVIFSSLQNESLFEVSAAGSFVCSAVDVTPAVDISFNIPSGDSISDYYVMANSLHFLDLGEFGGNIQYIARYRYDTTPNRIDLLCNLGGLELTYLIGKIVS